MAIDFYYTSVSAACRNVHLVAAALNLELNLKPVVLMKEEQLAPEFLKINPQHTLPTIVDDGFSLWESRAICRYLVNKYGANSDLDLYPAEPRARALVDQRLDFDLGTLYPRFSTYIYPQIYGGAEPDEELLKKLQVALDFLNTFLEGQKFSAGPGLTLADLALVTSVSTMEASGVNLEPYPNVERWLALMKKSVPMYERVNEVGLQAVRTLLATTKAQPDQ